MIHSIVKSCLELIFTLVSTMNDAEKIRLARQLTGSLRFLIICAGLAAVFASLHWLRWW